jgi:hypothetical protein
MFRKKELRRDVIERFSRRAHDETRLLYSLEPREEAKQDHFRRFLRAAHRRRLNLLERILLDED